MFTLEVVVDNVVCACCEILECEGDELDDVAARTSRAYEEAIEEAAPIRPGGS
jgi:hypothetical protein